MASMVCFCRRRKARLRRARTQEECQVVSTLPIPHHAGEGTSYILILFKSHGYFFDSYRVVIFL